MSAARSTSGMTAHPDERRLPPGANPVQRHYGCDGRQPALLPAVSFALRRIVRCDRAWIDGAGRETELAPLIAMSELAE